MHISKIIDYVKNEINFSQEFCEDNVFVTLRIESILRIIENLERSHKDILEITKENIKKDKIIDLMTEFIYAMCCDYPGRLTKRFKDNGFDDEECGTCESKEKNCLDCIKQYFKSKAEKE